MEATPNIFEYEEHWRGSVGLSAVLHVILFAGAITAGAIMSQPGESWGGGSVSNGAIRAQLVNSVIPLPAKEAPKENVLANDSAGLSESKPQEVAPPEPEAIPIPDRLPKLKPDKIRRPNIEKPRPQVKEEASNMFPSDRAAPSALL